MSSRSRRAQAGDVTRIVSVEPLGGVSLVRVTIGTGRTHQIRVHLSEAGHAVVGDALYGGVAAEAAGAAVGACRASIGRSCTPRD